MDLGYDPEASDDRNVAIGLFAIADQLGSISGAVHGVKRDADSLLAALAQFARTLQTRR